MEDKLPSVRFFGEPGGKGGYGNATKNFSYSFSQSSVDTSFFFAKKSSNLLKNKLKNYNGNCKVDFYIHTPPFGRHRSYNYKIGYFYWETDTLPRAWRNDILKNVNEIWAPCELVKHACIRAGFRGPIEIVPTPFLEDGKDIKDISIPSPVSSKFLLSEDVFKFYSIFQWHKRKGYQELLKAYFEEFSSNDNVILIIKTNPLEGDRGTVEKIKFDILTIKNSVNKKYPPKIFLITDFLSNKDIHSLHDACDCFVLPHKGEGWGMPIHDAMLAGNHIITTKYGGITEFLNNKNANIIPHTEGPVTGMEWSFLYESSQSWAYPEYTALMKIMRDVYKNRSEHSGKCLKSKKIAQSFSINNCANMIEEILTQDRFISFR